MILGKEKSATLAVLCCSYNLSRFVKTTLNSILSQTQEGIEIVVSDGGSTDDSLRILKSFSEIKLLTGPDGNYLGGLWRAFYNSQSRYVTQCCISDGYLDESWLRAACEFLDKNPSIALVWGLSRTVDETTSAQHDPFPEFKNNPQPAEESMYAYWLLTGFLIPEGNLVVRRTVFEKCMPTTDEVKQEGSEAWLEFNFRFHQAGYLSKGLKITANFAMVHGDQLGQALVGTAIATNYHKRYQQQRLSEIRKTYRNGYKEFREPEGFSKRVVTIKRKFLIGTLINWQVSQVGVSQSDSFRKRQLRFLWRATRRIIINSSRLCLGEEMSSLMRRASNKLN